MAGLEFRLTRPEKANRHQLSFQAEKILAWKQIKARQQVVKSKSVIAKPAILDDTDPDDPGRDQFPDLAMEVDDPSKDDILKAGKTYIRLLMTTVN